MQERNLAKAFEQAPDTLAGTLVLKLLERAVSTALGGEQYCGLIITGKNREIDTKQLITCVGETFQELGFQTDEHHFREVLGSESSHRLTVFWGQGKSLFEEEFGLGSAKAMCRHEMLHLGQETE